MLRQLRVENFKPWADTGKMGFAPITVFFGANGSGKSSIMQLLLLLKQTAESSDRSQPLNLGDERNLVELGTFPEIIHDRDTENALSWELAWDPPEQEGEESASRETPGRNGRGSQEIRHVAKVAWRGNGNGGGSAVLEEMSLQHCRHSASLRVAGANGSGKYEYVLQTEGNGEARRQRPESARNRGYPVRPIKCHGFSFETNEIPGNLGELYGLQLHFEAFFRRVYCLGPHREAPRRHYLCTGAGSEGMGKRGEGAVDAILAPRAQPERNLDGETETREKSEIVAGWLEKLRLCESFEIRPADGAANIFSIWLRENREAAEVPITGAGSGVSNILPVIALCYSVPRGSTVIIERPEISLHPTAEEALADLLIDAAKTRGIQLIVESHCEHMLLRLQRRVAEAERLTDEDLSLFYCRREGKMSGVMRLDLDRHGMINNQPIKFFGNDFAEVAAAHRAMRRRMAQE